MGADMAIFPRAVMIRLMGDEQGGEQHDNSQQDCEQADGYAHFLCHTFLLSFHSTPRTALSTNIFMEITPILTEETSCRFTVINIALSTTTVNQICDFWR
jgi:hypothetical protein